MANDIETGKVFSLKAIRYDREGDMVWLMVEEF